MTVTMGSKSTLKTLRSGKAKLILIAGNCPPLRKSELECKSSTSSDRRNYEEDLMLTDCVYRLCYARQGPGPPLPRKQRKYSPNRLYLLVESQKKRKSWEKKCEVLLCAYSLRMRVWGKIRNKTALSPPFALRRSYT